MTTNGEEAMMMQIADLAARWGVSPAQAKKIVRAGRVPFVSLGSPPDMRVNWRLARFSAEAVEAWEAGRLRAFRGPEPVAAKAPRSVVMRELR